MLESLAVLLCHIQNGGAGLLRSATVSRVQLLALPKSSIPAAHLPLRLLTVVIHPCMLRLFANRLPLALLALLPLLRRLVEFEYLAVAPAQPALLLRVLLLPTIVTFFCLVLSATMTERRWP